MEPLANRIGQRPTWAEIDLNALASNFRLIQNRVGAAVSTMPVVKANAYGHGAVKCAQRLAAEGAEQFAVALPEEGVELRNAGIPQQIVCLAGFWEQQAALCIQYRLTPVLFRVDQIEALDSAAADAGVVANFHVKIDTGMGRLGVRFDQLGEFVAQISRFKNIRLDGLMTHFAAADDPSCQPLTKAQFQRFQDAVKLFQD